jgi:hypothetical protein
MEIMLEPRDDKVLIQSADRQHTHNPATELTDNELTDNGRSIAEQFGQPAETGAPQARYSATCSR